MTNLTLAQALRHLVFGFVVLGCAYVYEPSKVALLLERLGNAALPIVALVTGVLGFYVYRAVLYEHVILRLMDKIHPENVRTILMDRYVLRDRLQAEHLWRLIQETHLPARRENLELGSAGTHLLYMTGVVATATGILLFIKDGRSLSALVVLMVGLAFCASALVSDYYLERGITLSLRSIDIIKVDALAKSIGCEHNKQTGPLKGFWKTG